MQNMVIKSVSTLTVERLHSTRVYINVVDVLYSGYLDFKWIDYLGTHFGLGGNDYVHQISELHSTREMRNCQFAHPQTPNRSAEDRIDWVNAIN